MSELEELKLAYAECSRQRNELLNKLKSQAQREWVGLTTDERGNILRTYYADMYDAAEVIEELLKEKNA